MLIIVNFFKKLLLPARWLPGIIILKIKYVFNLK